MLIVMSKILSPKHRSESSYRLGSFDRALAAGCMENGLTLLLVEKSA